MALALLRRDCWDTLPKPIENHVASAFTEKKIQTYLHRFNNALDVVTWRMSGAPASVTLNSISLAPFHKFQARVMSDESHFTLVSSVNTKLRNDSENDFPNVLISFKVFTLRKSKRGSIKPWWSKKNGKLQTLQENRKQRLGYEIQVAQRIHSEKIRSICREKGTRGTNLEGTTIKSTQQIIRRVDFQGGMEFWEHLQSDLGDIQMVVGSLTEYLVWPKGVEVLWTSEALCLVNRNSY